MTNKKILGLIGLSARARKISFGADSVETQAKKGKVKLFIIAEDASERTKDKFNKLAIQCNIPIIIHGSIEELSKAIGKNNKAIVCIKDNNFATAIKNILMEGI